MAFATKALMPKNCESNPLISIAVPTFRRPERLYDCLHSILVQCPADGSAEVLVIDNDLGGSAKDVVASFGSPLVAYVHEPVGGVAHARNRAVKESRGAYLAFIDDDEIAAAGWVVALFRHARLGITASFGKVVPRLQECPEAGLERLVSQIYKRDLNEDQDSDVSSRWAYLGTGNSLFAKAQCFTDEAPFDPTFNSSGGEDTWLIRSLVNRGLVLRWNPAAVVEEQVPAHRCTLSYLSGRRVRQGQLRVTNVLGSTSASKWPTASFWIAVGGLQLLAYGSQALCLRLVGSPYYRAALVKANGGLGKLLWWRRHLHRAYVGD